VSTSIFVNYLYYSVNYAAPLKRCLWLFCLTQTGSSFHSIKIVAFGMLLFVNMSLSSSGLT
jgi:hypothetical protein